MPLLLPPTPALLLRTTQAGHHDDFAEALVQPILQVPLHRPSLNRQRYALSSLGLHFNQLRVAFLPRPAIDEAPSTRSFWCEHVVRGMESSVGAADDRSLAIGAATGGHYAASCREASRSSRASLGT